jgi:alpha-mannosidase
MLLTLIFLPLSAGIKFFIVPHSHIDAGWIDKLEVYQIEHFEPIFHSVLSVLESNQQFKFCWSESIWLNHWLSKHPEDKERLKKLIKTGQIEIAGGGWVMHDEALTDFESVARQIETGHSFLKVELDVRNVEVAWQLDPFGHSSLTPALLKRFGFKYLVMGRVEERYKVRSI